MVRLIGYWHSEEEPQWPDPAWFVDPDWNAAERESVAAYLRAASVPWAAGGLSWCRFRCGAGGIGSAEHSDGAFLWPQGLVHYVEAHGVRLPEEFTQHVLTQRVPREAKLSSKTQIDTDWWLAQRGFVKSSSFRSPAPIGHFVARLRGVTASANVLAALRAFALVQQLSVPELRERILQGTSVPLLEFEEESPRPASLATLEGLGISIDFQPLDVELTAKVRLT